jgi:hypothetical protein
MSTPTPKASLLPPDNDTDERRPLLESSRDAENALTANVLDAEKRIWRFVRWVYCSVPVILSFVALGLFVKEFIKSGDVHVSLSGVISADRCYLLSYPVVSLRSLIGRAL